MDNQQLSQIFEGTLHGDPLDEILLLAGRTSPSIDLGLIKQVHQDVVGFFTGRHPDFLRSTLPYHNLRHSSLVVLASARLFHGLHVNHVKISATTLFKGLLAAYFHDAGMLVLTHEQSTPPTEYIAGHEARSIALLTRYCCEHNFGEEIIRDCGTIIRYTDLNCDPATFAYHNHEIQLAGQVLGSADILAQMADRYYLECLPLLFDEMEAAGVNTHPTALELMKHTADFYHHVVLRRLIVTLSNTSRAMRAHFKERHELNRNLYIENIDKNVFYLRRIIRKCNNLDCITRYLKRIPPQM